MSDDPFKDGAPLTPLLWAAALVTGPVVKAMAGYDPFPGWSGDPFLFTTPIVSLTPQIMLAIDAVILLSALGIVLTARAAPRHAAPVWCTALFACAVALLHAGWGRSFDLGAFVAGSSWASAIVGACSAWHIASVDPRARRLIIAALLGVFFPLSAKGVLQVVFEHHATIENYFNTRGQFLEAQGWLPDSPMALAYERRLFQAEASGWFGLSNVLATLAASASVAFIGLAWGAIRYGHRRLVPAMALPALIGVGTLYLTFSKGGWAALAWGLGALVVMLVLSRRGGRNATRVAMGLGLASVLVPLLCVALRGAMGERLSELSLLFRWFYMQGAARILGEHWLAGVGPDGFREAYLLVKNPLAPEDPISPHSIFLDWFTGLGLAGAALSAVLVWFAMQASGAGRVLHGTIPQGVSSFWETRLAMLVLAIGAVVNAVVEHAMATPDAAVTKLLGAALSIGFVIPISLALCRTPRAGCCAIGAGALAGIAHLQIEMTGTTPGACAWILMFIGVAASTDDVRSWRTPRVAAAIGVGVLIALVLSRAPRVAWWERSLRKAAGEVMVVPEFNERVARIMNSQGPREPLLRELAGDLTPLVGRSVEPTLNGVCDAIERVYEGVIATSTKHIERAHKAIPSHLPTAQALGRLVIRAAQRQEARGGSGAMAAGLEQVSLLGDELLAIPGADSAMALAWVAQIREAQGQADGSIRHFEVGRLLKLAIERSPRDPLLAARLAVALATSGDGAAAREWARTAIRLHEYRRLDPLSGLPDRDLQEMRRLTEEAREPG